MRRMGVAAAAAALAMALAGCGADSPKQTYQRMWDAAARGDRGAALACVTTDSQAKLKELERLAGDVTGQEDLIDRLRAQSRTAVLELGEAARKRRKRPMIPAPASRARGSSFRLQADRPPTRKGATALTWGPRS